MRRVLTYKLDLRQIRARRIEPCSTRTARAADFRESAVVVADDTSVETGLLERLAVILPMHAEVECQIGTELPLVFKISAHFALHLPEILRRNLGRAFQCCICSAFDTERLVDYADGGRQVC